MARVEATESPATVIPPPPHHKQACVPDTPAHGARPDNEACVWGYEYKRGVVTPRSTSPRPLANASAPTAAVVVSAADVMSFWPGSIHVVQPDMAGG